MVDNLQVLAAKELLARRKARSNLLDFTLYTYHQYEVNWHHRLVCQYLDQFVSGEIKRLMIFMPPRNGKSELVSRRLPAYLLGKNPDYTIIACSYGAELARRMNRDVQRIMDDASYRQLFPDTQLFGQNVRSVAQGTWLRNSDMFEVVGHRGYYLSTGVGGSITGSGAHVAIIDDPIKNRKEADSSTYRKSIYEWYTSTLLTRLTPEGQILLTVTRWHEDDLPGQLLWLSEHEEEADQWTIIKLPARAKEPIAPYDIRRAGDALWPARWSAQKLVKVEKSVGPRDFASLFQQEPSVEEGNIFKKTAWRYWIPKGSTLPNVLVQTENGKFQEIIPVELPGEFDILLQSWDLNFKDTATSDFVAGMVMGKKDANRYILDYTMERYGISETMTLIKTWTIKWPKALAKLIEEKANGAAVIQLLRNKVPGLIPVNPEGGKISRAYGAQPLVESGNVFLPHPLLYTWVAAFILNAGSFPNAAHDDDIDAFTQAMIYFQDHESNQMSSSSNVAHITQVDNMFGKSLVTNTASLFD